MNIVIDIKRFVNTAIPEGVEPYLYVSDNPEEIRRLSGNGHFVVPVLTDSNKDEDFSSYKYVITNPEEIDTDFYVKIWQRYVGLPWTILETRRCIIREMTEGDVEELYKVYEDDSITDYTEPLYPDYEDELEYTRNYINNVYSYFGFGTWLVVNRENRKVIGRVGFNYREGHDSPELGYVIAKDYQGQGIAFEVCRAVTIYGFEELGFERISAYSVMENKKSLGLLKKLGFKEDPGGEKISAEFKGISYEMNKYIKAPK